VVGERYLVPARSAPGLARALRGLPGAEVAASGQLGWVASAPAGMASPDPAAPAAPESAHGSYRLYILQLNVTDENGHPASNAFDVEVFNTDDVTCGQTDVPVAGGVGRITVPAGHYSAFAFFPDFSPDCRSVTAVRVVTVEDFTVRAAPRVTTVSIAERSASKEISVTAPRPAAEDLLSASFYRRAAAGNYPVTGISTGPGVPLYVSPAPAARTGANQGRVGKRDRYLPSAQVVEELVGP
jgi:hypothetical protein